MDAHNNNQSGFEADKPRTAARSTAEQRIEGLRDSGGLFVEAVRATRMPMAVTDPSLPGNPIVFANEAFLSLSGYSMTEVLGQEPHFMNGEATDPSDAARFSDALRHDRDEVIESIQYRKDGSRFVAAVFLSAFKGEDGHTTNQFLSYLDVTARVEAEEQLAATKGSEARTLEREARSTALAKASSEVRYRVSADWGEVRELTGDGFLTRVLQANPDWLDDYIPVEDKHRVKAAIRESIRSRTLFELEHQVRLGDGSVGWTHSRAVPILGPDGEIVEWFGTANDITERRAAEERLRESEERHAFLLKLSDTLRPLRDAFEVQAATMRLVAEHLDLARAGYYEIDPDQDRFELTARHERGAKPVPDSMRLSDFAPDVAQMLQDGRTFVIEDTEAEAPSEQERAVYRKIGVRAAVGVPLLKDGRLLGVLGVQSATPRKWTAAQIQLLEAVADRIWSAVERAHAEMALRRSEELLLQFGEASQDILWMRDPETFQWEYLTPAFETIYGLSRQAALRGDNMSGWLDLIVPADRELAATSLGRVRDGEWVTFEYRIQRQDGTIRWMRDTDFPITDEAGKVTHIGGIGHDITAMKVVEDQLRRSEERLRLAQNVAHVGMWDWDMTTNEINWSDEHFHLEGYAVGEVRPSYEAWLRRIHPDDQASAEVVLGSARDQGLPYKHEFRSLHPDGKVLWLSAIGSFFYSAQGQPIRMVGTLQDVTERREWQDHQQVLVAELQHRTRNLLGVVRSMADKTGRSSADLPEFRAQFRDRLQALARAQGLLSRLQEQDRVTFDELVRGEMEAMDGSMDRVTLEGPDGVCLRSSMVQTLSMALHELATNAIKYGALGQADGRLTVTWQVQGEGAFDRPWLHVDWRETGVIMPPAGSTPAGGGHGRELIERALPYQLGARTTYRLGPDGVHCTIALPVSTASSSREAPHV